MVLTASDNRFLLSARSPREMDKGIRAGFTHTDDGDGLFTLSAKVAARLIQYADESAKEQILNAFIQVKPWSGRIPYPKGLTPLPFQPSAANFALSRNRSYLALDPGLGKTIIAAMIANALADDNYHKRAFVFIVPTFLALNTQEELNKWLVSTQLKRDLESCIYKSKANYWVTRPRILIVPDSVIADPLGDHETLYHALDMITKRDGEATLFVDEAHRYKSIDAQRTHGLYRISQHFKRVVFLSGTPMPNRPMELYAILSRFAPETIDFKSQRGFGMRYCAPRYNGFGYDFKGASNVQELFKSVRGTFMLRLRKRDVLKNLPPKTEELIFLAENLPAKITKVERAMLAKHSPQDLMRGKIFGSDVMSTYRHNLGLAKVPLALAFIKDLLDNSDEAVLVFGEHTEVIARLEKGLAKYKPLVITGKTPKEKRQGIVKTFQATAKHRVFLGNKKACGVGFTLTKASRVIHVEPGWVPGDDDQASDRAHRIGQKDHVFVQNLVFKNSFDRTVIESNLRKRQSINLL